MPKPSSKSQRNLTILSIALLVITLPQIAFAVGPVQTLLLTVVHGFFGTVAGGAGLILDYSIGTFVVGFGELYESSGLGFSIDNLWRTVRDIFNLTFIFGLVFIGFKMIFNSSDSNARKMLGLLVMAALLVNFSLFITKFVIDFSNIAATQLAAGFETAPASGKYEVSGKFMTIMQVPTSLKNNGDLSAPDGAIYAFIFGSLLIYLVCLFVFAAGGILLIIRFAVLNIYMVLSPLMFLGWVFPGFSGVSREYMSGFLSRAFFAPAYVLMLYFSHQILVNMKDVMTAGSGGFAKAFLDANSNSFGKTMPFFILSAVFLMASIVVAQKMGSVGGSNAMALGNRITGATKKYVNTKAINTARRTKDAATYAVRAPSRMLTNKAGEWAEKKLNDGQTSKGWGGAILRTNVADRVLRGATTSATKAQFGTGTTNQAEKDYKAKTQSRANQTEAENNRKKNFDDANKVLADDTKGASDLNLALDELAKTMREMSKEEKERLTLTELTNKNIAAHLSDSDIENFEKSGKYGAQDINQIKSAKKAAFEAIAVGGTTLATVVPGIPPTATYKNPSATGMDRRSEITNYSTKDIGKMPASVFTDARMIKYIKTPMLDERLKNVKTTVAERAQIKANIDAYLVAGTTPPSDVTRWSKWIAESQYASMIGY